MKSVKIILKLCGVFILLMNIMTPGKLYAITPRQEIILSHEFMALVKKRYTFIEDPIIIDYVNRIGKKLVSVLPAQPFPFHFYVVEEDAYNAFAGPAGHIFINSGLFMAMDNENELAGLLCHELTHVSCRHISEKIDRSKKLGIATLAGITAAILLGQSGSTAAAEAITIGTAAAGQSVMLAYSREDEMQADQLGLEYLLKAGYDGAGLLSVLKKLRSRQWFGSKQIPSYLVTHPAVDDRIAYIDNWIQTREKRLDQTGIDNYEFKRAKTYLLATYGDAEAALQHFKNNISEQPDDALDYYGYGLSLARNNDRKQAINSFRKALDTGGGDPYIMKELGRLYYLEGEYNSALNILNAALKLDSDNADLNFHLGLIQMDLGNMEKAIQFFEKTVLKHPNFDQAVYSLGQAYGRAGKLGPAHYYLGLFYYQKGQVKNAVFHLKKALTETENPDEQQKIEKTLEKAQSIKKQFGEN